MKSMTLSWRLRLDNRFQILSVAFLPFFSELD